MQATPTFWTQLTDRRVLRIGGADARDFLNGLVTTDIAILEDGQSCHGGLLTPQGKIMFEFIIARDGDTYLIDVAEAAHGDLAKRLGFYKLRAAVEIATTGNLTVAAFWGAGNLPGIPDPRLNAMGTRLIATASEVEATAQTFTATDLSAYEAHRIALGVPEGIKDYPLGNTFPHEACFDQLNGVSFTKGCYVGQEVVSRMRHRGTARKRTIQVSAETGLPESGVEILADDRPIGTMGSSSGANGIAMIRLDRAAKAIATSTQITAAGQPVNLRIPGWADFTMSEPQPEDSTT